MLMRRCPRCSELLKMGVKKGRAGVLASTTPFRFTTSHEHLANYSSRGGVSAAAAAAICGHEAGNNHKPDREGDTLGCRPRHPVLNTAVTSAVLLLSFSLPFSPLHLLHALHPSLRSFLFLLVITLSLAIFHYLIVPFPYVSATFILHCMLNVVLM